MMSFHRYFILILFPFANWFEALLMHYFAVLFSLKSRTNLHLIQSFCENSGCLGDLNSTDV